MKTIAFLIVLCITNFITNAQETTNDTGISITVSVPNVPGTDGDVYFGLYNEATFMKAGPIKSESCLVKNGVASITFTNVPKGVYAISCFHDANGNNRMDFEANGMPVESYGVSNNNMSYGPPVWTDAKFDVNNEDLNLEIRM